MVKKWRQSLDSGGKAAADLTNLSKAFDCIDSELLILNQLSMDSIVKVLFLSIHTFLKEIKELKDLEYASIADDAAP